ALVSAPVEHQHIQNPYLRGGIYPTLNGVYRSFSDLTISPNDSILFYIETIMVYDSVGNTQRKTKQSIVKYWKFRDAGSNPQDLFSSPYGLNLNITPYGDLTISYTKSEETPGAIGTIIYRLLETNNPKGLSSQFQKIDYPRSFGHSDMNLYDYVRVTPNITYECDALVSFKNKSDLSEGIDSFVWIFSTDKGLYTDTVMGFEPQIRYEKNGKFPFKIHAFSSESDYSEWYLDMLEIDIPPKPVAAFNASDTLVCAYKSLEFESTSFADSFHKSTPAKLLWTFGDGETTTMTTTDGSGKISHTYKAPGTYTVSLFFSNGYCDSTLIKNQYIRVVDAPTPGFTIDYLNGCTPFMVNISDTNQVNMTKKEYYYSDIDSWINVSTSTFSHTFNSSGDFYIVQKLYGLTGCITQEDTAFVHVSPGISNVDSVHVINSTYLNNLSKFKSEPASIQIDWTTVPGTEKYLVYKAKQGQSRELLGETELNIWYDTLDKPQAVSYSILAQDSCGGRSASGRVGKPVFLQGEVIENNNTAILTFNGYEDWKTNAINYSISKVDSGSEVIFKTIGSPETVEDKTFAKENKLEQCYRITATGKGKTSYSNILCLPYKAIVLVPNAFSPNGDGLNDVFDVTTFGIESYSIMIYNRWGEQIFSGSNEGWTAESAMEGNYAYTIALKTADGKIILKSGMVSLLK
ncbi:MAG: gliding motility-associated C-terminal domain-containing protein, partial [Bacteroidota bacterium]|nr:gliding motility-associated C-terminal domain-containing protein [Bacteroidota bacterium]